MKRRLIGFKSQYLILLGLIFMVVVMVNVGDSSATNTTNLTDHNGMVKKASSSIYSTDPTNNRTKERFKSIEEAVISKNTINGDTIIVGEGNYTENVKIDKRLILMAFSNVNITAKDPDLPIFNLSKSGSGTVIKGFNFLSNDTLVSNAVLLNSSSGCTLLQNKFTGIAGVSVNLKNSVNCTIASNSFKDGMDGVDLTNSKNIVIKGNSFNSLTLSILMSNSSSVKIYNNNITNILGSDYLLINKCTNSSVTNNSFSATVQNPTTSYIIHTIDSDKNLISSNYLKTTGTVSGVEIQNSNSNQVISNKITGSGTIGNGIQAVESDNNLIKNNVVTTLFSGISLVSSLNNSIMNNTISKMGEDGIHLFNCFGTDDLRNLVGYNKISNCLHGVQLELSFHNSLFNNTISNSDSNNIYCLNSECNTFYQNNLSNAPTGMLFKNSDDCAVVSNVITSNSPDSCGIVLENSDSTALSATRASGASKPIIVGSIPVTTLPDIDVNFNRIVCPVGIKNGNHMVTVNAGQNWWGSNHPVFNKLVSGSVKYPTWIYMTIQAKAQRTIQGSKLAVTTSFNNLYDGKTLKSFNPKIGHLPNGTLNFFVTNLGKFEGNYLKTDTLNGQAVTTYSATKLGKALLTSTTDNQTLNSTITVEPVLKVIKLNTTSLQSDTSSNRLIAIYLNKQLKNCNGSWIELKQASKPKKLIGFKTRFDKNHIYISPKTVLKRGVTYKLIVHSNSVGDATGNGLSNAYIKTFKL